MGAAQSRSTVLRSRPATEHMDCLSPLESFRLREQQTGRVFLGDPPGWHNGSPFGSPVNTNQKGVPSTQRHAQMCFVATESEHPETKAVEIPRTVKGPGLPTIGLLRASVQSQLELTWTPLHLAQCCPSCRMKRGIPKSAPRPAYNPPPPQKKREPLAQNARDVESMVRPKAHNTQAQTSFSGFVGTGIFHDDEPGYFDILCCVMSQCHPYRNSVKLNQLSTKLATALVAGFASLQGAASPNVDVRGGQGCRRGGGLYLWLRGNRAPTTCSRMPVEISDVYI